VKAHVERLEGLTVVGWARNPAADTVGERIELRLDGRPLPDAGVRRLDRADVAAALGCERRGLGFEIDLPASLWQPGAQPPRGRIEVLVDGQPAAGRALALAGLPLAGLVHATLALQDDAERLAGLSRLRAHVEQGALWPLLDEHGAEALRRAPRLSGGPVLRTSLEQAGPLRLRGWAADLVHGHERFELRCNGRLLDAQPVRLERRDVAESLRLERLDLGFEIDVPGHAWDGVPPGTGCSLALSVNGQPLLEPPLLLQREDLARMVAEHGRRHDEVQAALAGLRAQEAASAQPDAAAATPQVPAEAAPALAPARAERARLEQAGAELSYQGLLLLEHVACAELLPQLPPADARRLRELAARSGLADYLAASAGEAGAVPAEDADVRVMLDWACQRRFNEAVDADGGNALPVLEALLREMRLPHERRQRFLLSLTPFMCRIGAFEAFQPWMDVAAAEPSDDRWRASLALPFLAHARELQRVCAVLRRMAQHQDGGWVNTECVLEAVRLACAAHAAWEIDDEDFEPLVHEVLAFLEAFQGGYWSRLQDRNLLRTLAALLVHAREGAEALYQDLVAAALRHYGLCPDFWAVYDAAVADAGAPDEELEAARRAFARVAQRLREPRAPALDDLGPLLEALAGFRQHGNPDARLFERELLMAVAAEATEAGAAAQARLAWLAQGLDAAEPVRLASLPLAAGNPFGRHVPALAARVRELRGLPKSPQRRLQRQAAALLAPLERAVAAGDAAGAAQALSAFERCVPALCTPRAQFLGFGLCAAAYELACGLLPGAAGLLASLHDQLDRAVEDAVAHGRPLPASVTAGLGRLASAQRRLSEPLLAGFLAHVRAMPLPGVEHPDESPLALPEESALQLRSTHALHDVLVVVYSCRPNLETRVAAIRRTWLRELQAAGIAVVVLVGGAQADRLQGDVLELAVSDRYEDLPAKTLRLLQWVQRHTDFQHVLKIDDDCYLDVEHYFGSLGYRKHHYHGRVLRPAPGRHDRLWHQGKSSTPGGRRSIDKSPEGSVWADGGSAYSLSRHALGQLLAVLRTRPGVDLVLGSLMEDKLVGDLLRRAGIEPSNEDYELLVRRRTFAEALPVNLHDNTFYPGRYSSTQVVHLDTHLDMERVHREARREELTPHKLWPTFAPPRLGTASATNQLELLSPVERVALIRRAPFVVVAVMRNEQLMLPHFLAHYRRLGAECFVIVDNLSTDGTREALLAQPDVVLYSADTPYGESHYGVAWQQAVLGNHCLGKWALLADADELLVFEGCEQRPLTALIGEAEAEGADAVRVLMIDMYPQGPLHEASLEGRDPFEVAPWFDRQPLIHWKLGSGPFGNAPALLSALRHRLIPNDAPNLFTSQKLALLRYQPWMRLSAGLHFAAGMRVARRDACFAHFKYHAAFQQKTAQEIARKQHFDGAADYRKYQAMVAESSGVLHAEPVSARFAGSASFAALKYAAEP
jgi:hypothetical protein